MARQKQLASRNKTRARTTTRLPDCVRPTHVELKFRLDPTEKTFRGSAHFTLELSKRRRMIELHAADLHVSNVRAESKGEVFEARVETYPEAETVVLRFDRVLPSGSIRLELDFRGTIRNDLRGLYRSVDQDEVWIATQLCPTDARRFFPCFDEPGIKAQYRIQITAPNHQTVLSNSPIESEQEEEPGWKTVQFKTTPPLSAYLIAVVVGPFVASTPTQVGSTPICVYTLPGRKHLATFALETAAEGLARLEDWFAMEHPFAKLDLVALPDFAFGAMENAGAVFFRDSVLLLDPAEASFEDRKRTAETIIHEISHMWFGNLVTMAWWNDLWLNESFATWMAYEIIAGWQPSWEIWLDFAHRREAALIVDALASSHPIAPRIRNAKEAHENFDAITYTKGASVLRMLEGFLGAEIFQEGIRLYIKRHQGRAATASDLWSALSEVSGLSVENIVAPWTLQTGYPLLSLRQTEKSGQEYIELFQQRFLAILPRASSSKTATKPKHARWQIPWVGRVGRASGSKKSATATTSRLLVKLRDLVPLSDSSSNSPLNPAWVYGNAREAGFFRVQYNKSDAQNLLSNLPALTPAERIGFVGNQWALARSGRIPISQLLDLLSALGTEQDPDVLWSASNLLGRIGQRLAACRGPQVEKQLRAWVATNYRNQLLQLGLEARPKDTLRTRMRRARIFSILGEFAEDDSIHEFCRTRCDAYFTKASPLPVELGDTILRIAASQGDASLHQTLCDATRDAETPQTRRQVLFALAGFREPKLLRATLVVSMDTALAPAPDRAGLLATLLANPKSAEPTWRHLQKSWSRLEKQMPPIPLARLAAATADALPHSAGAEIKTFFKQHPLTAGSRVLRQVAEEFAIAKRFEDNAGNDLETYLANR